MKVLWFTSSYNAYVPSNHQYNGGGWVSSLEREVANYSDVELAVCFASANGDAISIHDGVKYYSTSSPYYGRSRMFDLFKNKRKTDIKYINHLRWVIEDFKPDIINIFGTENVFGLLYIVTEIPIVIHIQGLCSPIFNAFLPPFYSKYSLFTELWSPIEIYRNIKLIRDWKYRCKREKEIIRNNKLFLGRTTFDKDYVRLLNKQCKYSVSWEIMRSSFYLPCRKMVRREKYFVSVVSSPLYKGVDVIIKTVKILVEAGHTNFEWHIYGNVNHILINEINRSNILKSHIILKGVAGDSHLANALDSALAFVHVPYIDNSPNSVCEAQLRACPVVCTNVGGIASLVQDGETGFLIPSNDPYSLASRLLWISRNNTSAIEIGYKGQQVAIKRHDKESISKNLIKFYNNHLNK